MVKHLIVIQEDVGSNPMYYSNLLCKDDSRKDDSRKDDSRKDDS